MNRAAAGRAGYARGKWAETLAAWLLRAKGYRILGRRVAPPRGSGAGEIDIVARRGRTLAFVEIKARPSAEEGLFAVSPQQQRRLLRAAAWFTKNQPRHAMCDIRFDVVVVAPGRWPLHLPDAWRGDFL
ncbi:YraN family protein [Oleispirillum naphthae]|uniref:YraN family protein n=1 Tax=Oleispirillum naphthae TaxID=2838853 RepID=UPI0030824608